MWAPVELADNARTRRDGNALDDGTEPRRPPHRGDTFDHTAAIARLLDASGGTRRDP
jgi:hypothetical protein